MILVVSSSFASAYVDVTFNFDQNNVQSLIYNCLDENCNNVASFSGTFESETTDGNLEVIFPSTLMSEFGYAVYFFSEGYIPKEYVSTFHSYGDDEHYELSYDIDFNKVQECQSLIDEFTVVKDTFAYEPLQIDVSSSLDAVTASAFSSINNGVGYVPQEMKDEYYSSDVEVELVIEDQNGNVVKTLTEDFTIYMNEQADVEFSWTPEDEGKYTATVTSNVIDSQCSLPTLDASSAKEFNVLPGRPTNEYYTILNDLDVDNSYPVAKEELTFTYTKISNYADSNHDLTPVGTEVIYYIYYNGDLIDSWNDVLNANSDYMNPTTQTFTYTPENSGQYVVIVDGVASDDLNNGNPNNSERIILNFNVADVPAYEISFQVRDSVSGEAIENALITINGQVSGTTDLMGALTFVGLESGTYTYVSEHDNYQTRDGSVQVINGNMEVYFTMVSTSIDDPVDPIDPVDPPVTTDITFTNNPLTIAYVAVPYEFDLDAISSNSNSITFEKVNGPDSLTVGSNGQIEWLPLPHDIGVHTVKVKANDGSGVNYLEWAIDVKSKMSEQDPEINELSVIQIRFPNGYLIKSGSALAVSVMVENTGDYDLDDVRLQVSVPSLGLMRSVGPFDVDENDEEQRTVMLDIPKGVSEGEYELRIVIGNEDYRAVKYRPFGIN